MRDDDKGNAAFAIKLEQEVEDLCPRAAVQVPGRFIRQDDRGFVDQRPGDRHSLLLPSGKLHRPVLHALFQSDQPQHLLRAFAPAFVYPGVSQRQFHIRRRRRTAQQVETLEYETHLPVADFRQRVVLQFRNRFPVQPVGARGRPVQAADDVHQGAFPGSGRPHDRHDVAALDAQGQSVQGIHVHFAHPVHLADIFQFDHPVFHVLILILQTSRRRRPRRRRTVRRIH